MSSNKPLVIVGGGLAGSLAALAIAEARPDVPLLLVEAGDTFGGNHTWSFFDGDVVGEARQLVEAMTPIRWNRHSVRFPGRDRNLGFGYNSIHSSNLDAVVRERLAPTIQAQRPGQDAVGRWHHAGRRHRHRRLRRDRCARAGRADAGLELAGRSSSASNIDAPGHGLDAPIIMDATVDQSDGYRFVYSLPFSADRLLVEDTYYTNGPALDDGKVDAAHRRLFRGAGLAGNARNGRSMACFRS